MRRAARRWQVKELLDPFYHTYICKDGRPFYVVAPCHAIHQRRVLEALGVWDQMVAEELPVGYDVSAAGDSNLCHKLTVGVLISRQDRARLAACTCGSHSAGVR